MKKIISVLLAAILTFSVSSLGFTALADTTQNPTPSQSTETANTKPPSPSTIFGKRKNLSAVKKYDFSKHTTSKNTIPLEESRTYKIVSRVSESDTVYIGFLNEEFGDVYEGFLAVQGDNIGGIFTLNHITIRMITDKDYLTAYEKGTNIGVRVDRDSDIAKIHADLNLSYSTEFPQMIYDDLIATQGELVHVFRLTIGGERYIYEYFPKLENGFLIDAYGELCANYSIYHGNLFMGFHAFTTKIPAYAFAKPAGYEVVNFEDVDVFTEGLIRFFRLYQS